MSDDLASRLREQGLRLTPQRELILRAVEELRHATPDEVLAHVRAQVSSVNASTVYRTLEVLEGMPAGRALLQVNASLIRSCLTRMGIALSCSVDTVTTASCTAMSGFGDLEALRAGPRQHSCRCALLTLPPSTIDVARWLFSAAYWGQST